MILMYWTLAILALAIIWRYFVKGYVINWVGAAKALPGILFDVLCQVVMSIGDLFPRRRKAKVIRLDEFEKKLS
jgi:hypothetical protein